jgi:hypothetical protein
MKGQLLRHRIESIQAQRDEAVNRTKLKNYAPQARRDFIQAMTDRAAYFGLTAKKIEPVVEKGDVAVIGGRSHPRAVARKRKQLEERIKHHGFDQTMEALAYTWFNRLVAIRFMELHGYLDHGYRVLSHPEGKPTPEILEHAEHVEMPGLKKETVIDLKLAGNKEADGTLLILIGDMKSTVEVKVEHRLQVAFYRLMLERLFKAEGIAHQPVQMGILFRPPAEAAVIAWMRHQTTGYEGMMNPRAKGKRPAVPLPAWGVDSRRVPSYGPWQIALLSRWTRLKDRRRTEPPLGSW